MTFTNHSAASQSTQSYATALPFFHGKLLVVVLLKEKGDPSPPLLASLTGQFGIGFWCALLWLLLVLVASAAWKASSTGVCCHV
jgi:hypothetical protein